jgi:Na+/H+-dicarboxylate symporter
MSHDSSLRPAREPVGMLAYWRSIPLYLRILGGCILGVLVGLLLGEHAWVLQTPSRIVLQLLAALAAPLILVAVVQALARAEIPRGTAPKLLFLLLLNTLVAIIIGLAVANVVRPGSWSPAEAPTEEKAGEAKDVFALLLENIPKSLFGPLGDNGRVISVILLAVAFGLAFRQLKHHPLAATALGLVEFAFEMLLVMLHWVIEIIPFAVFGIVASIVGVKGFRDFIALGGFVIAVLIALALQAIYYLVRIHFASWVRPLDAVRGVRDALVMAFSTASSTVTMPLTYACLREKVGLRERSASLGALVGANFNNDGTALYEAMAALFISQTLGLQLTFAQQLLVVLTSVVASVGAAGIPEAGLVTMTLVFTAVGLPVEYIAILLTVDWFLDRCRTAINVMGDVNVSCILDGKTREAPHQPTVDETKLAELA